VSRAWLLPFVFVGCSIDRRGLDESPALIDSAHIEDSASAADTVVVEDVAIPDTEPLDTAPADTAPPDPLFVECESGAFFGDMTIASDTTASAGRWASVSTTAMAWGEGTGAPPSRVELPVTLRAGTWYVWVAMYTRAGDADAMYVGFAGGPLRRFFTLDWNQFKWVGAEGSGARLEFTVGEGAAKLYVGAGEPGTGCDRVALTRDATWTPP